MVKLEEVTNEKYFPRGGGSDRPKPSKTPKTDAPSSKNSLKRKSAAPEENEAKKVKEESSWIPKVDDDMFIEGLTGLGVVSEVYDDGVILHTTSAQSVRIDASEVSKKFTELVNAEKIGMKDAFQIGQMIPFKVLVKKSKGEKGKVKATCNPARLNKHLTPNMLVAGLVINTSVSSIEEKGAILDVGLDQMSGFIEKNQFPASGLKEGLPLLVRVLSSTSRVVKVTSFVEQDNLNMASCEKLQLNHLMPGTILDCEPTGDAVSAGVIVNIGNGLKGILPRRNLPPRLRENPEKLGKAIRAVVMFCQQNSKVLVLSAHPDLVAVSRIEKRTSFEGISLGDKIKCTVMDVIATKSIVYFTLPPTDGKKSLVTAISSRGLLEKPDAVSTEYKVGDEKLCRVTGFRYADRTVIVSTRKDILQQKITKYQDAKCGDILDARVRFITKSGIHFTVCNFVRAFVPLNLLSDKPLTAIQIKNKFKVGTETKCRVWKICDQRKNLIVTCRERILALKGPSANCVEEMEVGKTMPCFIKKVFPTGVVLLVTYNDIGGVLRKESAIHLPGTPKVHDYVEANVEKIEDQHRIVFVLRDVKSVSTAADTESSDKKLVQRPKPVDGGVEVGKVYNGTLTASKGEKANVKFTGKDDKEVFATVDDHLLSDLLDAPVGLTKRLLIENKETVETIVPMGKLAAINRASVKRFVAHLVKGSKIPKKFEDLKEEQVVVGIVGQVNSNVGVFVELVGGSGLVGRILEKKGVKKGIELFEVGQVVVCKICNIDTAKKMFFVDPHTEMINGERMLEQYALPLLECIVNEVKWLAEQSKLPSPGSTVSTKVTKELDDLTLVEFEHNGRKVAGVVNKIAGETNVVPKKKKKSSNAMIVVDINHSTNEVVLAPPTSKDTVRIVSIRRDYLCAISSEGLVYLPTRLHLNHLPAATDSSVKIHDIVELSGQKKVGEGVFVATRGGGDVDDVARTTLVVKTFVAEVKEKTDNIEKKTEKKTIKNFGIYEGTVIGQVHSQEKQKKNALFAEVRLPGDNLGRLHISELSPELLKSKKPMEEFLKRNSNRKVVVRIIGFTKVGKSKVPELTMIPAKLQAGKIRGAELSFKSNYSVGDLVKCFGAASLSTSQELRVEVNPLWTGTISRENISEDLKVESAESGIVDLALEKGEVRPAKVVAVDRKAMSVKLSLDVDCDQEEFKIGSVATGRVFFANKTSVRVKLSTGEQAIITPTSVSNKYENFEEYMEKTLKVGQLVHVVCARIQEKPKRYYVVLKQRHADAENGANEKRPLILDQSTLKEGQQLDAVVQNPSKKALFVELGPGISGRIPVTEENEEVLEVGTNSVVRVTIVKITEQDIALKLDDILIRKWTVRADRKRTASKGDEALSKVAQLEEETDKETVDAEDPGFDWSNKGFRNEDLAAVGKLTNKNDEEDDEEDEDDEDEEESEESGEEDADEVEDEEEEDGSDEEEEEDSDEEKVDLVEKTEDDHSRLVRSDPNSAINWIEYMSLFVEKSDLAAARKTAEEALSAINPTESEELLKMWTAYLNMEVAYGDAATVQKVFERACKNANSYTIHKTLAKIYQKFEKHTEATQILETMVKKFRANQIDVWTILAEHLMAQKDLKAARDLLPRALKSAPKAQQHIQLISKFAQLEFKLGDAERGRTLLEGLVTAHPKKTDLWLVYAEAALKHLGIEHARKVLERACNLGLSIHKMRPMYKKWLEMESKHGDAASVELVKSKAEKFLQSVADNVLEEDN